MIPLPSCPKEILSRSLFLYVGLINEDDFVFVTKDIVKPTVEGRQFIVIVNHATQI